MDFIDYYKILELDKGASEADIKKAYRKLARKYHPDVNPNDQASKVKFQQINEAHEVLSDPEKRKKYDQYGKDWKHSEEFEKARQQGQQQQNYGGHGGYNFGGSDFSDEDFSDFFSSMFGGSREGRGTSSRFRGQDFNAELQLDLRDVYTTQQKTLTVNGKNIRLSIPAGVENGQTIKISGHGGAGINGGPNGDLFITFVIGNSTKFRREKNDLHTEIDIDLFTAVLGGEITADTFDGKVKLTVKPETQNGTKVKLKGKGFPVYKKDGEFGDLYITFRVLVPKDLSDQEKQLFRELQTIRKNEK